MQRAMDRFNEGNKGGRLGVLCQYDAIDVFLIHEHANSLSSQQKDITLTEQEER